MVAQSTHTITESLSWALLGPSFLGSFLPRLTHHLGPRETDLLQGTTQSGQGWNGRRGMEGGIAGVPA